MWMGFLKAEIEGNAIFTACIIPCYDVNKKIIENTYIYKYVRERHLQNVKISILWI